MHPLLKTPRVTARAALFPALISSALSTAGDGHSSTNFELDVVRRDAAVCTTSSLTEMMTPRMPPLVVTRSPFFNWLNISCHFFLLLWLAPIITKYNQRDEDQSQKPVARKRRMIHRNPSLPASLGNVIKTVAPPTIAGAMFPKLRLDPQPGLEVLEGEGCRRANNRHFALPSCRCRAQISRPRPE